jgi:hypothetical protein
VAFLRPTPQHRAHGDEQRLHDEQGRLTYAGNFTKCQPHDEYGFLQRPTDYSDWVRSIDSGDPRDFLRLRLGPGPFQPNGDFVYGSDGNPQLDWAATYPAGEEPTVRAWESQGGGSTFELEGSDAQALTMPPYPALASQELISEMGEVYWMALSRDIPFTDWGSDTTIPKRSRVARPFVVVPAGPHRPPDRFNRRPADLAEPPPRVEPDRRGPRPAAAAVPRPAS